MSRSILAAGVVACMALCAPSTAAPATPRFSYQGLPPLLAGVPLAQAEGQLGEPLPTMKTAAGAAGHCAAHGVSKWPGVVVTVDDGGITRVETRDARYASISGVRVGDSAAKAQRVYGKRLSVTPHLYFAKGLVLAVYSPDRRYALVMESNDDGRIITLRAGAVPAVEHLEGCSP